MSSSPFGAPLQDGDLASRIPQVVNMLTDHVLELKAKAEDLGGFESLARIAKLEVDAAHFEALLARAERIEKAHHNRLVDVERKTDARVDVMFYKRLFNLACLWLVIQVVYCVARLTLMFKGKIAP